MIERFLILSVVALLVGCGQEPSPPQGIEFGEWQIVQAERDGKSTKSLEQATIYFVDSARLVSNLISADDTLTYTYDGATLSIPDRSMDFKILQRYGDTLQLFANINNHRYVMSFRRTP